ncbi:uncharacterized protein B4U79_16799 [Dinothrombium tinctorium]|uniref:BTB domain-containing protein n=1 Tax=Dinothrombium tinctorium TaxID=1965070 RepID=A0A3S3SKH1_9ACAR|nr:uncharacterized protein B4U79_16799 [Dinothrombium tinctorium]
MSNISRNESKRVCVRKDTNSEKAQSPFKRFFGDKRLSDVDVYCERERIACHRLVLSNNSAYFEHIFDQLSKGEKPVIVMPFDMKLEHFKIIIELMYCDEVIIDCTHFECVQNIAKSLQMRSNLVLNSIVPIEGSDSSSNPYHEQSFNHLKVIKSSESIKRNHTLTDIYPVAKKLKTNDENPLMNYKNDELLTHFGCNATSHLTSTSNQYMSHADKNRVVELKQSKFQIGREEEENIIIPETQTLLCSTNSDDVIPPSDDSNDGNNGFNQKDSNKRQRTSHFKTSTPIENEPKMLPKLKQRKSIKQKLMELGCNIDSGFKTCSRTQK